MPVFRRVTASFWRVPGVLPKSWPEMGTKQQLLGWKEGVAPKGLQLDVILEDS